MLSLKFGVFKACRCPKHMRFGGITHLTEPGQRQFPLLKNLQSNAIICDKIVSASTKGRTEEGPAGSVLFDSPSAWKIIGSVQADSVVDVCQIRKELAGAVGLKSKSSGLLARFICQGH